MVGQRLSFGEQGSADENHHQPHRDSHSVKSTKIGQNWFATAQSCELSFAVDCHPYWRGEGGGSGEGGNLEVAHPA